MAHSDTTPTSLSTFVLAPVPFDSVITESDSPVLSLQEAAAEIKRSADEDDDRLLRNAIKAAMLKQRIINGEAGKGVHWREWMLQHIDISQSYLYALVKIGSAENPVQELREWRADNNDRSKDRNMPKAGPDNAHLKRLVRFISLMPASDLKAIHTDLWLRYPQYRS